MSSLTRSSSLALYKHTRWNFIKIFQSVFVHLLRTRRSVKSKCCSINCSIGLPVLYHERILRGAANSLTRDHVLSRNRICTFLHPKLPIDVLGPESKMVAFDS